MVFVVWLCPPPRRCGAFKASGRSPRPGSAPSEAGAAENPRPGPGAPLGPQPPPRVRRAGPPTVSRGRAGGAPPGSGRPAPATCSRGRREGPTTALLARCCRVLSPSPDPALPGDESGEGAGAPTGRPSATGTGPSGLTSGGRRRVAGGLRGTARPSFPATPHFPLQEHVRGPPSLCLLPPAVFLGTRGRGLGRRGPRPRGVAAGARDGVGRGLLAGAPVHPPPPPPGRAPTPRPLLLGKPAGPRAGGPRAAGGGLPRPLRHPSGGLWVTHPAVTALGVARRGGGAGPAGPEVDGRLPGPAGLPEPPCSPCPGSSGGSLASGSRKERGGSEGPGDGGGAQWLGWAFPSSDRGAPKRGTAPPRRRHPPISPP
ncbi:basic proline-rich protein-like [Lynx canadensis]|uniref:basic proline-rich protein-like n=1 Tax=Lynx canadensis TaxID=61383 RepID=UPI0011B07899|nr:basic proline-rich protein-like [Lynx canadensis]